MNFNHIFFFIFKLLFIYFFFQTFVLYSTGYINLFTFLCLDRCLPHHNHLPSWEVKNESTRGRGVWAALGSWPHFCQCLDHPALSLHDQIYQQENIKYGITTYRISSIQSKCQKSLNYLTLKNTFSQWIRRIYSEWIGVPAGTGGVELQEVVLSLGISKINFGNMLIMA